MSGTGRHASAPARLPARGLGGQDGAWPRLSGLTAIAWRPRDRWSRPGVTRVRRARSRPRRPLAAGTRPRPASGVVTGPAQPSPGISIPQSARAGAAAAAYTGRPARPPSATAPAPRPRRRWSLTAADHQDCPAAATACVDLARHITWLQAGGKVTFGPVRMEPGKPGRQAPDPARHLPRLLEGRAGVRQHTYHEPMPWATFFAAGGIAFHGGSLTQWSHGCVHLTRRTRTTTTSTCPSGPRSSSSDPR